MPDMDYLLDEKRDEREIHSTDMETDQAPTLNWEDFPVMRPPLRGVAVPLPQRNPRPPKEDTEEELTRQINALAELRKKHREEKKKEKTRCRKETIRERWKIRKRNKKYPNIEEYLK